MKRKIAQVLAALILVTSLSSCYVYDAPVAWLGGYSSPVYRPGYSHRSYGYPSRSYGHSSRSYGYPSRSYSPRGHSHGGYSSGHHHHHSSRPSHHGHRHR